MFTTLITHKLIVHKSSISITIPIPIDLDIHREHHRTICTNELYIRNINNHTWLAFDINLLTSTVILFFQSFVSKFQSAPKFLCSLPSAPRSFLTWSCHLIFRLPNGRLLFVFHFSTVILLDGFLPLSAIRVPTNLVAFTVTMIFSKFSVKDSMFHIHTYYYGFNLGSNFQDINLVYCIG